MSASPGLPSALRSSAVPRWSHRDPVEGGNPFPTDDPRHESWANATRRAQDALVRFDMETEQRERRTGAADAYAIRVVGLAAARFDVWARRGLCAVGSGAALCDYAVWLEQYQANWLVYVRETCPNIDVDRLLWTRLTERVEHWKGEAGRSLAVQPPLAPGLGP